jgi:hypothetical protein
VYDFGMADDVERIVDELNSHQWNGKNLEFQVCWNAGETTWELLELCKELAPLDRYLTLMGMKHWQQLHKPLNTEHVERGTTGMVASGGMEEEIIKSDSA